MEFILSRHGVIENDSTLLTIRQAGHFVQHDAVDLVTRNILN
jgi:hypothetical protein